MNELEKRRKNISKILNWIFWLTLITGIVVIPFFGLEMKLPRLFKITRLIHLILGFVMTVLVVMHLKLERRWGKLMEGKDIERKAP